MKILHAFADSGVESEALSDYGDVTRLSINVKDTNDSTPIKGDATDMPFRDGAFDLALLHPPCGFVSPLSDTNGGSREEWPNLIPDAREEARRVSEHYIIENKKEAREYMADPVILNGRMFNLPVDYARAFETTFDVEQPVEMRTLGGSEGHPFFSSEHSREWWASAKGYPPNYTKGHLAKNCVPRAYIQYLMQAYFKAVDNEDRPDYSDYDARMDKRRAEAQNHTLDSVMQKSELNN